MKLERKFCVQPAPSKSLHILHMQAPPFLAPLFKVQSPIGPSTRWTGAVPTKQHPSPSHHCVLGPPPADDSVWKTAGTQIRCDVISKRQSFLFQRFA